MRLLGARKYLYQNVPTAEEVTFNYTERKHL